MAYKILLVDDDPDIRDVVTMLLETKGYETVTASNGLDALKMIERSNGQFDILITDIVMPSITGVAIISVLKNRYPQIPVIAITGYGQHPEALAGEANADLVIKKPIELSKLEESVIILISKSAKQ